MRGQWLFSSSIMEGVEVWVSYMERVKNGKRSNLGVRTREDDEGRSEVGLRWCHGGG